MLGVLAWLGFMATLTAAQATFQRRPWNGWVVGGVHDVIVHGDDGSDRHGLAIAHDAGLKPLRTTTLPGGARVPVLGLGTWRIGEDPR